MSFWSKIKNAIINYENKKTIKDLHPGYLIGLFLLGFAGLQVIAIITQLAIAMPLRSTLLNPDFLDQLNGIDSTTRLALSNLLNGVALFSYYFIAFIIFILLIIANKNALSWVISCFKKSAVAEGFAIALMMYCCAIAYNIISSKLFPSATTNENQQGIENAFSAAPLLSFFSIVIFAPVVEELTYRVGLFGLISKKSKILAYIVTVLVFALIHFDFSAENIWNELVSLPAYLIGAVFLCYAYSKKGNVVTSIVAHSVYNGIQFLLMLLFM